MAGFYRQEYSPPGAEFLPGTQGFIGRNRSGRLISAQGTFGYNSITVPLPLFPAFSVGKAAAGAILLGPIGLVGGALGKKKECYYCGKCGFQHEY